MPLNKILKFVGSILLCEFAGVIGAIFTTPNIRGWYAYLNKPFFSPPNWIFAPVWTMLYVLMGISLYLIWSTVKKGKNKKHALLVFFAQLLLNTLWSIFFFGLKAPILGMMVIIALWVMIFLTIKAFIKLNKTAAYLLYPYLAWVSFASSLNLAIMLLNF